MVVDVLQFILDMVVSAVQLEFAFMPVIVMAVFAVVVRLLLRRYN